MKTILVPTDFSAFGFNATHAASALAEKTHARIILQHNIPTLMEWTQMTPEEHREHPDHLYQSVAGENKLHEIMGSYSLRHLNVSQVITHGVTYEEIIHEAIKTEADLIVIGSHGNEQFDRLFIGSNIQKVLREAPCPVMTINEEIPDLKWKKVVVPFPFDQDISASFEKIKAIALDLGSVVHLLHISNPDNSHDEQAIRNRMEQFAKQHPQLSFEFAIYRDHEVENGILAYCHDIQADWIAMVAHNRIHKDKYLVGISEIVAFRSRLPLLIVTRKD